MAGIPIQGNAPAIVAAPAPPPPAPAAQAVQFAKPEGHLQRLFQDLKNRFLTAIGRPPAPAPATPDVPFKLGRVHLRGDSTTNLLGTRDAVFGSAQDRTAAVAAPGYAPTASSNLNANIALPNGQSLRGFTQSADPQSPVLDTQRPVIVFFSGSGSRAESFAPEILGSLNQPNCNFVAFDYRGFGNSSAIEPSENSITKDGLAVINHLLAQGFQPDQIILHGYSLGASVTSRVQAIVESSGHELRGVVYDRPMSSASGAAKSFMSGGPNDTLLGKAAGTVTAATAGSLSTRKNLEDLLESNPQGVLRSPTYLVADQDTFGDRSSRMGQAVGIPSATMPLHAGGHDNHAQAIASLNTLPGIGNIYL